MKQYLHETSGVDQDQPELGLFTKFMNRRRISQINRLRERMPIGRCEVDNHTVIVEGSTDGGSITVWYEPSTANELTEEFEVTYSKDEWCGELRGFSASSKKYFDDGRLRSERYLSWDYENPDQVQANRMALSEVAHRVQLADKMLTQAPITL